MKPQAASRGSTPRPPSFLVISLDDDQPVAQAVQKVIGKLARPARASGTRARTPDGVELFAARRDGHAQGTLFHDYNIAAVDLDPAEVAQIRREDVIVVPNELRHILGHPTRTATTRHRPIPDPVPADETADEVESPDDCWGHRCIPFGPQPLTRRMGTSSDESLRAYLEGQRATLDAVLGRMGQALPTAAASRSPVPSSAEREWHLAVLGLQASDYRWTGRGVKVAVLDTGLDLAHPDFAGRISPANCRSFVIGAGTVADGNGHGTHCCGLVNGPATPQQGPRYSAAPEAELLVGKVMSDAGEGYDSWIISGIAWAAAQGARVISLSLGSERERGGAYAMAYEQIARKLARAGRDCLLVAAAGNESDRPAGHIAPVGNPAACPAFLAVAAVNDRGLVADFSCGQLDRIGTLELSAPGVAVRSSIPVDQAGNDGPYERFDGTSMATPLAAGVAALWREARPELSAPELWRELVRSARQLGRRRDFGFGLVQVP